MTADHLIYCACQKSQNGENASLVSKVGHSYTVLSMVCGNTLLQMTSFLEKTQEGNDSKTMRFRVPYATDQEGVLLPVPGYAHLSKWLAERVPRLSNDWTAG